MRLLHIVTRKASDRIWIPEFVEAVKPFGDLTIIEDGEQLSDEECAMRIRECDVLLTGWGARPVPLAVARDPGQLGYVCNVTGSMCQFIPLELIESGIPVTNWGDAPANRLAEGAVTLLLACVKNLRLRIETVQQGGWRIAEDTFSGTLEGLNLGVYGCGEIGRRFVKMLKPFRPVIRIYDPYAADLPDGCIHVDSLDELFATSEAIALHAGLSDETRGAVTADLLAKLPDNGIIINTARGAIIDQEALFAELERGRLLAGLDVLDPDRLPDDHPAKQWPNVIFTAHSIGKVQRPGLELMHEVCLDNLKRYVRGEPLRFVMDRDRYLRST